MDQELHELCNRIRTLPQSRPFKPALYEDISEAEAELVVSFPEVYQVFLRHCNGGDFPFGKLHRVGGQTGKGTEVRDAVRALEERLTEVRERSFLPMGELSDGRTLFLDLSRSDSKTAPVIEWRDEQVGEHETFEAFLKSILG